MTATSNITNKNNDSTFDNDTLRIEVMASLSSSAAAGSYDFEVHVSYDGTDNFVLAETTSVTGVAATPPTSTVTIIS